MGVGERMARGCPMEAVHPLCSVAERTLLGTVNLNGAQEGGKRRLNSYCRSRPVWREEPQQVRPLLCCILQTLAHNGNSITTESMSQLVNLVLANLMYT